MNYFNKILYSSLTLLSIILPHLLFGQCEPPMEGDWIVSSDCTLLNDVAVRGNVFIINNAVLTVPDDIEINIDLTVNRIEVQNGAQLVIKNGGQLLDLPPFNSDGQIGFYFKEVNGSVLRAYNENISFYPASSIKVLEHLHVMRMVQSGTANLNSTILGVCTGGQNCTNNQNTAANCGGGISAMTLSQVLSSMMVPSNNASTNAIQEFVGNGDPLLGRSFINNTAYNVLGLSNGIALFHKFGCGNINNNPANIANLVDLAKLYEEVAEDDAILQEPFKTSFYQLMRNETTAGSLPDRIFAIVDALNVDFQLSAAEITAFKNAIKMAWKSGGVSCCKSDAGWIQLPLNNGANTKDYVMAAFTDNFNDSTVDFNDVFEQFMEDPIRDALLTW